MEPCRIIDENLNHFRFDFHHWELEIFCLKRYAFPKKGFHDTSNTVLAILRKTLHQVFGIFPVKFPKTKTHWNTLFLESKHAYSDYNPMDTSNTAFETPSNFLNWVLKFRLSESEKKWWEYVFIQSEKLQLGRSTRQI